jgi:hypothetical protein
LWLAVIFIAPSAFSFSILIEITGVGVKVSAKITLKPLPQKTDALIFANSSERKRVS